MCDFTLQTIAGLIALFNILPALPDCSDGHEFYGYNDDKQELVCWGYLTAEIVEVTDVHNSYSLIGIPAPPSPSSCEFPSSLPTVDSFGDRVVPGSSPTYLRPRKKSA